MLDVSSSTYVARNSSSKNYSFLGKDHIEIRKFDGSNFALWKNQMRDVLVQRRQTRPLGGKTKKPDDMDDDDWEELDALTMSTIRLHLADSVYFTVLDSKNSEELWKKLCTTYEKETAANKVYLMRKLYDLRMKDTDSVASHLNQFDALWSQLQAQKMTMDDELKAVLLLCTLPTSWDTFCIAISNSAPKGKLVYTDISGALLSEEIRRKSMVSSQVGDAYNVRDSGYGKNQQRGRSQTRNNHGSHGKSRSKSRKRLVECHYCHKKGHIKKDCYALKNKEKEKGKTYGDGHVKQLPGSSSSVRIEEINATCDDDVDILVLDDETSYAEANIAHALVHTWLLDSGASFHVTPHREWFTRYEAKPLGTVRLGDSHQCDVIGIGDVMIQFSDGSQFTVQNVRHVPELTRSLMSVGQLDDIGFKVIFASQSFRITKGNMVIAKGNKVGSLYPLVVHQKEHLLTVTGQPMTCIWHGRLGHMSRTGMETLSRSGYLPALSFSDFSVCEHCQYGKQTKSVHRNSNSDSSTQPLDLVHTDVCGPMPTRSLGGAVYFVTFIDDATRKVWVYPIKEKGDVYSIFKKWLASVETEKGIKLKALRSDNGGEYTSHEFRVFCESRGIRREFTAPYTPVQNGVAERMNRTIQDRVVSMLHHANLPQGFWAEAVRTAVHVINLSPNTTKGLKVAQELWTGKSPNYDHLRVFGCEAYVHVPKQLRQKLDFKSRKCIFLGYGTDGQFGYRLWDPETRTIVRSSDVVFNEKVMHKQPNKEVEVRRVVFQDVTPSISVQKDDSTPMPNSSMPDSSMPTSSSYVHPYEDVQDDDVCIEPENIPTPVEQPVRRSTRFTKPPARFTDYVMLTDAGEPSCYKEAILASDHAKWEHAMRNELDSIHKNGTWDLVPLPKDRKALPCKWVYKYKYTADSASPKYKARLVAKGFKQEHGVDFDEIFSPVVKMTTLRMLLALAANQDLELVQMDVKTAFLHGDLDEEIYMEQPEGYEVSGKEHLVCKLKKSLYGLKQSPRLWYQKFDAFMKTQGYARSNEDACLYTKTCSDGSSIMLILYVDDMLIVGKNKDELSLFKKNLSQTFDMKDLGDARHILGMRITRDRSKRCIYLSQVEYISKVLKRFNMENAKPLSTPLPTYVKLSTCDCPTSDKDKEFMSKVPYQSAVGSLMYAMVATRPDIAFAVGAVSRFMSNPGKKHWDAVKLILRYLSGTKDKCLCLGRGDASIIGYTDSDYAGCADSRKSTSGYIFLIMGGAIAWRSRLQECVALSTTEAEYVAASEACKEAVWLSRLASDMGIPQHVPKLLCDSQSGIGLAKNPVYHAKTKHIGVRYHFIRECVSNGYISLEKVVSRENAADALTKALPHDALEHCCHLMGIT